MNEERPRRVGLFVQIAVSETGAMVVTTAAHHTFESTHVKRTIEIERPRRGFVEQDGTEILEWINDLISGYGQDELFRRIKDEYHASLGPKRLEEALAHAAE